MNMAMALNRYRATEAIAREDAASPYEVVQVTLRELTRSLNTLVAQQEQGIAFSAQHLNRSITAIYILQSSLDFEIGGELANDLFQLYEFARFHVLKAWRDEEDPRLAEAAQAMADILSAWNEMPKPDRELEK